MGRRAARCSTRGSRRIAGASRFPPLGLVRRGGADDPPRSAGRASCAGGSSGRWRGRCSPRAARPPRGPTWLLRDGRAVVELRAAPCERRRAPARHAPRSAAAPSASTNAGPAPAAAAGRSRALRGRRHRPARSSWTSNRSASDAVRSRTRSADPDAERPRERRRNPRLRGDLGARGRAAAAASRGAVGAPARVAHRAATRSSRARGCGGRSRRARTWTTPDDRPTSAPRREPSRACAADLDGVPARVAEGRARGSGPRDVERRDARGRARPSLALARGETVRRPRGRRRTSARWREARGRSGCAFDPAHARPRRVRLVRARHRPRRALPRARRLRPRARGRASTTSPCSSPPASRRCARPLPRRRRARSARDATAWRSGEGAAVLALARCSGPRRARSSRGSGRRRDAVHLTAPDREGRGPGARRDSRARRGGPTRGGPRQPPRDGDAVQRSRRGASARACARRAVERARRRTRSRRRSATRSAPPARSRRSPASTPSRAACCPASAGEGALDPDAPARMLDRAAAGSPRTALKLACAFGGANAALVVADRAGGARRARRGPVYVRAAVHVDGEPALEALAAQTGTTVDRLARADGLVRLALAAVGAPRGRRGRARRAPASSSGRALATRRDERALRGAHPRARRTRRRAAALPLHLAQRRRRRVLDRLRADGAELLGRRRVARGPRGAGRRHVARRRGRCRSRRRRRGRRGRARRPRALAGDALVSRSRRRRSSAHRRRAHAPRRRASELARGAALAPGPSPPAIARSFRSLADGPSPGELVGASPPDALRRRSPGTAFDTSTPVPRARPGSS